MPQNANTQRWLSRWKEMDSKTTAEKMSKVKEYIVSTRKVGSTLYLRIPASLRKQLGLYEGQPVSLLVRGKEVLITPLPTLSAAKIALFKKQHPRSRIPWQRKLKVQPPYDQGEQSDLM